MNVSMVMIYKNTYFGCKGKQKKPSDKIGRLFFYAFYNYFNSARYLIVRTI
jgi:hypothetical protein